MGRVALSILEFGADAIAAGGMALVLDNVYAVGVAVALAGILIAVAVRRA